MNETVLVLGGSGFIGKNLCEELSKNNFVINYDIFEGNFFCNNILQIKGSLNETQKIRQVLINKRISIVIHCISNLIPRSNYDEYLKQVENIYNPTINILRLCSELKIKFVYLSSGGVLYESSEKKHAENDKILPLSFYALSKLNIENAINFFNSKFGMEYIILRKSNPYGYGQSLYNKNQGLIANIFGKIIKNQPIEIWGDGCEVRDYIYINDFVKIISLLLDNKQIKNMTFNVGSGVGVSVNNVISIIEKILDCKLKKIYMDDGHTVINSNILDISLLRKFINIEPINITEGISLFYDLLIENKLMK